jgi:Domain of unknown function (DUF4352)
MDPPEPPATRQYGVGERSPDGLWQWNGHQWVAAAQPAQGAAPPPYPGWAPQASPPPGHVGRNLAIGCGAIIAAIILLFVLVGIGAQKATETQLGNQSCSPAPCGDDGSGFEVYVDSINRNLQPNDQFSSPEPGNHFVLVTVHFKNNANGEQSANPLNFVLQDSAGVKHALTLSGGSQCPVFSAVNLTKGSTLGPKAMCFEAGGDPKGKLTLVWTPGLHDVDIDLSSAKPA